MNKFGIDIYIVTGYNTLQLDMIRHNTTDIVYNSHFFTQNRTVPIPSDTRTHRPQVVYGTFSFT